MMFRRLAILIGLMLLLTFAFQGCAPEYYLTIQLEKIGGKPYMLTEYIDSTSTGETFFSVYAPKDEKWAEWQPVVTKRLGRAVHMFAMPSKPAPASDGVPLPATSERLGILHAQRVTLFDLSTNPPGHSSQTLPFEWLAETTGTHQDTLYAFGVDAEVYQKPKYEGGLLVARYDGQQWQEVKVKGPTLHGGESGIWLQAVPQKDGIRLFWREYRKDQVTLAELEGPRVVTDGPLMMARFDGQAFVGEPVAISNLPRGNVTAWADGDTVKFLVQTRHQTQDALSHNGPMEIWKLGADGIAQQVESIEGSRKRGGLLAYLFAQHYSMDGQEFIVRSNPQIVEIWRKASAGTEPGATWSRVMVKPAGLPTYDLESMLLAGLGMALTAIIFGVGLAFHRRRAALLLVRKIRSQDIYASLGVRVGAYAVDLMAILTATCLISRLRGTPFVSPFEMLTEFLGTPHWPFFFTYLGYLTVTEWLTGTTAGKFLMGLCVVADNGERPTLWAAVVRNFVGFFERLPPVCMFVTMWMIIFSPRRQRIGDIVSRSFVVHKGALQVLKDQRAREQAERKLAQTDGEVAEVSASLLPPGDMGGWGGKDRDRNEK
ncbi:MAG TPA: RDD family protein [Planctomycetota bacterium]|jgi:uncharacterized RDD family membrane protein YckC